MQFPEAVSFSVETEVSSAYLSDLLVFIYQKYIVPLYRNFSDVRRWFTDGKEVLAFTFLDPRGSWYVDVEIIMGNPIEVKMTPSSSEVPQTIFKKLKDDLIIAVQLFEENVRKTTLYFAYVPHKGVVPEKVLAGRKKVLSRIFMGNMLLFFVLFLAFSYLAFLFFQENTPIVLVIAQFFIVLFADKIVGRMGDWPITAENPYVHILQYHIPPEEFEAFRQRYKRDQLMQMKREIYDRTLAQEKPIDPYVTQEVFAKHGINIRPENLLTKTINVYQTVKEAAGRFNLPVPKIMISNVIIPNAAATGPSPRFGLVLLTTGLLVQIDEEELLAVVAHEMSHVKGRDPLALFALVSIEYLLNIYLLLPLFYFFGFLYYFASFILVYFIAKFFEARADLESAIKLGQPEILANALRKIGYRRIQYERLSSTKIGSWLGMDPHPPVSFRIERLEELKDPQKIRHPFIQSIKDCVNGLLAELKI